MAEAKQTANGKAFEYACLISIYHALSGSVDVQIEDSVQMETAKTFFENADEKTRVNLMSAAYAAVKVIVQLEPRLDHPKTNNPLYITIQTDAQGIAGDVRDVVCIREKEGWQVGISCKHNHHAVKHSRLSDTIDFGNEWFGIPCSQQYFSEIVPLFKELRRMRDETKNNSPALWGDIDDKAERYYKPILKSFLDELQRLAIEEPEVPARLIKYLLGRYDFYKVITDDSHRTTRVEAINISGTLNQPAEGNKSIVSVEKLKLPSRFYHADFKPNSNNTVEVVCDEGWTISMRIHNASSRVEPSLKFDVQLISLPSSIYAQVEPWDYENKTLKHLQAYMDIIKNKGILN